MNFQEKCREYARIIAGLGVNVTPDKYAVIRCDLEAAELGRMVQEECFKRGAKDVILLWSDQRAARTRLDYAAKERFAELPAWQAEQRNYYAREGCVSIAIIAEDPEIFAGADSEKLMASTLASRKAFKEFYDIMDQGGVRWTVVAYPSEAWAKKVFPDASPDAAVEKLWEAILTTVRIGDGDAEAAWRAHDATLKARAQALNAAKFKSLRYHNSLGTDFTVGLAEGHIWKGGSECCRDGVWYFPNMPTEEIFTMPDCRLAEGKVCSSLPLSYQGELIEEFTLTFREGKVVGHSAKKGEHALTRLLDTDAGSRRLGEVALIGCDSPICRSGILFYNTLFDENASCHLALGECYPDTVKGGEAMTKEELATLGGNESANHVDFMIGTEDLSIDGIKADGTVIPLFRDGKFCEL